MTLSPISEILAFPPAALAVTAGVLAAQINGPVVCGWRAGKGVMKRRLLGLRARSPGGAARLATAGLITLLLAGGTLAAYAAEPSAPERLTQEIVGVVGSGDQLSLKIAQDQNIRTLRLNEEYRDGWKLQALTPATATLGKNGEIRQVGLNPTGALAQAAPQADPTKVAVAGGTLEAREAVEKSLLEDYWRLAGIDVSQPGPKPVRIDEMRQLLGETRYQAFLDNDEALGVLRKAKARADALAAGNFNAVRAYDGLPVAGPDSFEVPPGLSIEEGAQAVGLPSRLGYGIDPTRSGINGRGIVLVKCHTPLGDTNHALCAL